MYKSDANSVTAAKDTDGYDATDSTTKENDFAYLKYTTDPPCLQIECFLQIDSILYIT